MYVCPSQQSREDFTRVNTEGSPQDVNHEPQKQEGQIRVCQTTSKKAFSSGTTSYGQMRPRSTCTRVMGREEYGEGKELLTILSIPPHQWSMVVVVSWRGHVWLPVELVLLYLLMMWLLTKAAGWILKCFGQYYLLIFRQMLQNSLDGASQCRWTITQSILQSQSPDLNPIERAFHLLKTTEGKTPQEQAGAEDGCSRGLAEHHRGWNPASGDVYAFQTSDCN